MSHQHTCHTAEFKASVALAALSGLKDGESISREYGVTVSQVNRWKRELIDNAPRLFGENGLREYIHEAEIIDLFHRLNRLAADRVSTEKSDTSPPHHT